MVYLFLSSLALVLVTTSFHYMYCLNGIEEAYLGLYKGVVEKAVVVSSTSGAYLSSPTFHLATLRKVLDEYLLVNLSPYCRSFDCVVASRLPRPTNDTSTKVVIQITISIDDIHDIEKTAHFSIWRTSNE